MIVTLDDSLKRNPYPAEYLEKARGYQHSSLTRKAKEKGYGIGVASEIEEPDGPTLYHDGLVGLLSHAYSRHLPVAIAPHDLWFIANCELAALVAKNPERFRSVFTKTSEGKEVLTIPTLDPTVVDYAKLVDLVSERIPNPDITDLLIPNLTTMNTSIFHALCASLADIVQHYYEYMTYCCGIPAVRILGTEEDYRLLAENARKLSKIFYEDFDTLSYYNQISTLLDNIADTFTQEDPAKFWRNIFTQENVGSGGQVNINGWIKHMFTERGVCIDSFNTSIAAVPYKNMNTEREFLGLVGAFISTPDVDGFYTVGYRQVIYEKGEPPKIENKIVSSKDEPEGVIHRVVNLDK
jgi:hypothetical protein